LQAAWRSDRAARYGGDLLAIPLICAFLASLALAPAACRMLAAAPLARVNYRGVQVAAPLGLVVVTAGLAVLGPVALAARIFGRTLIAPEFGWIAVFVLGVALLGLADDALADEARGWRGHLRVLRLGRLDGGIAKAIGVSGLALYAMSARGGGIARFLIGAAVLVLATNAFNLVDLRPGRAIKALVALGVGLTVASGEVRPLWALGLFVGPAVVVGFYDLREQGMLGDCGANLLGALAGVWLVLTLSVVGLAVALGALALITVYGEFRSISALIDRTPLLRELDSLGRLPDVANA
jgi:UDP-N-acetylmuramyl pentapeptide phosphotransferase/UDP-N-acetylglucosamine-1-phosphate transferase